MFKKGQQDHSVIKGSLGNKRKQRKKRKQNETKIEIEISKNQINNTNYDVQAYNDNEAPNRKRINDEKAFDEQHYEEEKEMDDDSGEETDNDVPDLINRLDDPEDQNCASDSEGDSDNDNDAEQKQKNQDPMKINSGFLNGTKGIFKDKKNNNQKKTRKMGKFSSIE